MAGEAILHQKPFSLSQNPSLNPNPLPPVKKKRNLPGTPDPNAEVIALSPKTLLATNRFLCEICGKGFQRDQNLQLHRRGHNLPWKLRQRSSKEPRKRVYVCPEKSCVHHNPARALGDLTGIKKHFCRKHGEKKWKCDKCSKRYAVQSDWKAHSKTCGTREYRCDCGTLFSRRDSFITHRAFCDALAQETARMTAAGAAGLNGFIPVPSNQSYHLNGAAAHSIRESNTLQHFASIFKPIVGAPDHNVSDQATVPVPGLSLWMCSGTQATSENLSSSSNNGVPFFDVNQIGQFSAHQGVLSFGETLNWMYFSNNSNKISTPASSSEMITTTSIPITSNEKDTNSSTHESLLAMSTTSLFSNEHHQQVWKQQPAADMSATALLQKAAQIGVTAGGNSTTASLFTASFDNKTQNQNSGMYNNNNDMLLTSSARSRGHLADQTRDFLGVGMQTLSCPTSINRW